MNKLNSNIVGPGKNRSKNTPKISENRLFLFKEMNNLKAEIKQIHTYLGHLNHKVKIIKQILSEVK